MAVRVQNHMHMDLPANNSGAPENSPLRTWRTSERMEIPQVIMSLERTLTGKLMHNVLHTSGSPVQFKDLRYIVKCGDDGYGTQFENLAYLLSMNGNEVSVVDHYHADDNEDHTNQLRTMILSVEEVPQFDPALQVFYVPVYLTDNDTV